MDVVATEVGTLQMWRMRAFVRGMDMSLPLLEPRKHARLRALRQRARERTERAALTTRIAELAVDGMVWVYRRSMVSIRCWSPPR